MEDSCGRKIVLWGSFLLIQISIMYRDWSVLSLKMFFKSFCLKIWYVGRLLVDKLGYIDSSILRKIVYAKLNFGEPLVSRTGRGRCNFGLICQLLVSGYPAGEPVYTTVNSLFLLIE